MEPALATFSLALYGVTVSVELARRSSVKGDGFDRLVFGIGNSGKDLHYFMFQEVNSHGERYSRLGTQRPISRLANPVRGGGEDVVAEQLHVISGVDYD